MSIKADHISNNLMVDLANALENKKMEAVHKILDLYQKEPKESRKYKGKIKDKETNCLHLAARLGDIEVIKRLIEICDANINDRDEEGRTVLMWAIADYAVSNADYSLSNDKQAKCLQFLIEKCGANVTDKDKEGRNILQFGLHYSRPSYFSELSLESVKYLIENFKDKLDFIHQDPKDPGVIYCPTMSLAVSANGRAERVVLEYFINKCGVPPDALGKKGGDTFLSEAIICSGDLDKYAYALHLGAVITRDNKRREELRSGYVSDFKNEFEFMCKYQGRYPREFREEDSHRSFYYYPGQAAQGLLDIISDPEAVMARFVKAGIAPELTALIEKAFLDEMLYRTRSLNARDEYHRTALMLASEKNNLFLVRTLLKMGAGTHFRSKNNKTALESTSDPYIKTLIQVYSQKIKITELLYNYKKDMERNERNEKEMKLNADKSILDLAKEKNITKTVALVESFVDLFNSLLPSIALLTNEDRGDLGLFFANILSKEPMINTFSAQLSYNIWMHINEWVSEGLEATKRELQKVQKITEISRIGNEKQTIYDEKIEIEKKMQFERMSGKETKIAVEQSKQDNKNPGTLQAVFEKKRQQDTIKHLTQHIIDLTKVQQESHRVLFNLIQTDKALIQIKPAKMDAIGCIPISKLGPNNILHRRKIIHYLDACPQLQNAELSDIITHYIQENSAVHKTIDQTMSGLRYELPCFEGNRKSSEMLVSLLDLTKIHLEKIANLEAEIAKLKMKDSLNKDSDMKKVENKSNEEEMAIAEHCGSEPGAPRSLLVQFNSETQQGKQDIQVSGKITPISELNKI